MKRLFAALTAALFCLSMPLVAYAYDNSFCYDSYDVKITVHENNTISVTETITADFLSYHHGIIRSIPETQQMKINTGGRDRNVNYATPVSDISVKGAKYEVEHAGYCDIKIGDENEHVIGLKTYVISYKMNIGEDYVPEYDFTYWDVLGPDNDVVTKKLTFDVSFDKPADLSKLSVYRGKAGSTTADGIKIIKRKNGFSGKSVGKLKPYEAVTFSLTYPEGYFTGEKTASPAFAAGIVFAMAALFAAAVLIKFKLSGRSEIVETVEFYPPDEISPAEIGFIIDGKADNKDLISLIPYFAEKGYLKIKELPKDDIELVYEKGLPGNAPLYMRRFFNALFDKGHNVRISELGEAFYKSFMKSKTALAKVFGDSDDTRRLFDKKVDAAAIVLSALNALLTAAGFIICGMGINPGVMIPGAVAAVLMLINCLLGRYQRKYKMKAAKIVIPLFSLGYAVLCAWAVINMFMLPAWTAIAVSVLGLLSALTVTGIYARTEYMTKMLGRLLGFKKFIKTAELDKLNTLIEQDPSYFYGIIPYAYVFGLTDVWAKKFEKINLDPPAWYSSYDLRAYTMWHFIHHMNHIHHGVNSVLVSHMNEQAAKRISSASSGFSSGGGGFSGGGFGGGGSSGW